MNRVNLVGRITKDPEVRQTGGGLEVCNFTVAINRPFKNQSGEYDADFVNCVAFNQNASFLAKYVTKGQLIAVEGRIQTRSYDDNTGKRVFITEVVSDRVAPLESRRTISNTNHEYTQDDMGQSPQSTFEAQDVDLETIDDEDLPF